MAIVDAPRRRKQPSAKSARKPSSKRGRTSQKGARSKPVVPVEARWWIHAIALGLLIALSTITALTWNAPAEEVERRMPRTAASDLTRFVDDVRDRAPVTTYVTITVTEPAVDAASTSDESERRDSDR